MSWRNVFGCGIAIFVTYSPRARNNKTLEKQRLQHAQTLKADGRDDPEVELTTPRTIKPATAGAAGNLKEFVQMKRAQSSGGEALKRHYSSSTWAQQ